MAQPIGGIAYLKVDGRQLPLRGAFTVSPSAVVRAGVAGQDYVHGYTELPRVPFIEGDVSTTPELNMDTIESVTNATVTADLVNGHSYVLSQAWFVGDLSINTHDGMARVRFEGVSCTEIQGAPLTA